MYGVCDPPFTCQMLSNPRRIHFGSLRKKQNTKHRLGLVLHQAGIKRVHTAYGGYIVISDGGIWLDRHLIRLCKRPTSRFVFRLMYLCWESPIVCRVERQNVRYIPYKWEHSTEFRPTGYVFFPLGNDTVWMYRSVEAWKQGGSSLYGVEKRSETVKGQFRVYDRLCNQQKSIGG